MKLKFFDNPEEHLKDEMQNEISTFMSQFENSKDKAERTQVLQNGRTRLSNESAALRAKVEEDIKELLFAKEVALKLNNLLANYSAKLTKDRNSELKLADSITIKGLLRDKLQREMQGFRTGPNDYKELDIVNPEDITKIINEVQLKVGN